MDDKTRYRRFIGGNNLVFTLIVLILLGTMIFLYTKIAFIFEPLIVIVSAIIAPVILATVTYYLTFSNNHYVVYRTSCFDSSSYPGTSN